MDLLLSPESAAGLDLPPLSLDPPPLASFFGAILQRFKELIGDTEYRLCFV